jgi:hypothetical protein
MKRSSFAPSACMLACALVSQLVSFGPPSGDLARITTVVPDLVGRPVQLPVQRTPSPYLPFSPSEVVNLSGRWGGLNIDEDDVKICSGARESLYFNFFLEKMLLCTASVRPFEYPRIHKPPWV